ncbi:CU044_2847 family protein [Phytohabitans sp. LJ34]|uniref:CU044_2847 family protein n=1 Tax=Phytohabitans sp. LJ34 TaxID=3452217 RepID=UPI003F8A4CD0
MTEYVDIRTAAGDVVPFEVADPDEPVPAGRRADRSDELLEQGVARLKAVASSVTAGLAELAEPPERVTVEIGLSVTAEATFVVARAASTAQIRVVVEWGRSDAPS